MQGEKIEEYFMAIMRKLGVLEEHMKHAATEDFVHKELDGHRKEFHRPTLAGANGKSKAALIAAVTSLAGGLGYALHYFFG